MSRINALAIGVGVLVVVIVGLWAVQLAGQSRPPSLGPAIVMDSRDNGPSERTSAPPASTPTGPGSGTSLDGADPVSPPSPPPAGDDDDDDDDDDADDYDEDD